MLQAFGFVLLMILLTAVAGGVAWVATLIQESGQRAARERYWRERADEERRK